MRHLGRSVPDHARVLDFGCGTGATVHALNRAGYDAWGVDIVQAWETHERLKLASLSPYRLPFPDDHFDVVVSDQVMEHVFDYESIFAEVRRVLRPSGLSIHHFPGPLYYWEGHLNVPAVALCRWSAYRALCALWLSRRRNTAWRKEHATFNELMSMNNYPGKRRLRRAAESVGLAIDFVEGRELFTRFDRTLNPMARAGSLLLSPFLQRLMILRHPPRDA